MEASRYTYIYIYIFFVAGDESLENIKDKAPKELDLNLDPKLTRQDQLDIFIEAAEEQLSPIYKKYIKKAYLGGR